MFLTLQLMIFLPERLYTLESYSKLPLQMEVIFCRATNDSTITHAPLWFQANPDPVMPNQNTIYKNNLISASCHIGLWHKTWNLPYSPS